MPLTLQYGPVHPSPEDFSRMLGTDHMALQNPMPKSDVTNLWNTTDQTTLILGEDYYNHNLAYPGSLCLQYAQIQPYSTQDCNETDICSADTFQFVSTHYHLS